MDLHVTLAAGPGVRLPADRSTEEVVITAAHLVDGEQLHDQLSARTGASHFLVDGTPVRQLAPGTPPLVSGAVIVAASSPSPGPGVVRSGGELAFLVRSGPDAGTYVPLPRGRYTIGRSGADIVIHDPELSRVHAILTVTNDSLTLSDNGSANGVWVDGSRVSTAPLTTRSDIRLGSSRCALSLPETAEEPGETVDLDEPCEIDAPPPPEANRILVLTAVLPLVLGLVLAVTTGLWFFLAFSALSAVTGLLPLANARRKRLAFETAAATATAADQERRRRAAPDIGSLAVLVLRPRLGAEKQLCAPGRVGRYLRLGLADQTPNIQARPPQPSWTPPSATDMPALIPLDDPESGTPVSVIFRGPEHVLTQVAHLVLLQLSALCDAGDVLCYGPVPALPHPARFLPRITLVAEHQRLRELLASGRYSSVLLFQPVPEIAATGLRIYAFHSSPEERIGVWTADYRSPEPVLASPDGAIRFRPDYVRAQTFTTLARAIGTRIGIRRVDRTSAPEPVALPDLIACDNASIVGRWRTGTNDGRPRTCIGLSASGPLVLDLVRDGPHLLVAGTTGSGKSEFLKTLVLGLCLNCSPADLNLLFVDFKGGSGLGPLAPLPHVTGMFTDLSAAAVSRALVSLRAELKRREVLFAGAGATDYLEYRERSPVRLPRLIVVIDEFRMLSEEVPGAVNELMRIATLGRSLGLHLVLATQRAQGAITSDIRANITASVALRMQSSAESQDVIDSSVASSIPVDLPGRGFLRVASGRPIEFQTATASGAGPLTSAVVDFTTALASCRPSGSSVQSSNLPQVDDPLQSVICSLTGAAQAMPDERPRPPVLPPLPASVSRSAEAASDVPQLGLIDIPEHQQQFPLMWNPACHSHLAFVGASGSGLAASVSGAAGEHARRLPDRHMYVLDGDASLRAVRDVPQVGAYVTASEPKRAARVIQRIAELVAGRLDDSRGHSGWTPALTLFVTGWGRWSTALRSGRFAWAEDALQDIVRDGESTGIAVVVSGEREVSASRFFALVPNRLFLPLDVSTESLLSWPKLPPMDAVPGRAFVEGRISQGVGGVAQLIQASGPEPSAPPAQEPFRVAPLPRFVDRAELPPEPSGLRTVRIPIGMGGDAPAPVHLELPERSAALVVGAAGTGKSTVLDTIAATTPQPLTCVRPLGDESPDAFWTRMAVEGVHSDVLLLVDDAGQLSRETHQRLASLVAAGARAVLACAPSPALGASPVLAGLRLNPLGIILGPQNPADGDIFGVRLEVDGSPPAGRGILVHAHRTVEMQVASVRLPAAQE